MSYKFQFDERINLYVKGIIPEYDAKRQTVSGQEILRRLKTQPGVILADEVGMGKTFVALSVAVSVALKEKRPIVVMVPSNLHEKWERDFKRFMEKCLPEERGKIRAKRATRAVEFLKLLDDPEDRRCHLIFITHGTMYRSLTDKWVKLAMIRQSLKYRKNIAPVKKKLYRFVGRLLKLNWVECNSEHGDSIWYDLLNSSPEKWLKVLHNHGVDPENDDDPETDDDPVPQAIANVLDEVDLSEVFEAIQKIPSRETETFRERLVAARKVLDSVLKYKVWEECVKKMRLRLPLLILDEAHHLKNGHTTLARLFENEDVEEVSKGAFGSVFERMVFLTATPFQLGHYELCSILHRFKGIDWDSRRSPEMSKDQYEKTLEELHSALDKAQESAVRLDRSWGKIKLEDLERANNATEEEIECWWKKQRENSERPERVTEAINNYDECIGKMRVAETLLAPLVIRHVKMKYYTGKYNGLPRRKRFIGSSIIDETTERETGISINSKEAVPFLLAARASCCSTETRPVFAEGLASSYEAFINTRQNRIQEDNKKIDQETDIDDDVMEVTPITNIQKWYVNKIYQYIPKNDVNFSSKHPKIQSTASRALNLWEKGEKVLIFCHYVQTGRALRRCITHEVRKRINSEAARKIGCNEEQVEDHLIKLAKRFDGKDSAIRKACEEEVLKLLQEYPKLSDIRDDLIKICIRYIRTPSFLSRYFSLENGEIDKDMVHKAFVMEKMEKVSLRDVLKDFFSFLHDKCESEDRKEYIEELRKLHPGKQYGISDNYTLSEDEFQGEKREVLIPNVKLANGSVRSETRNRIMLSFNTPFYPEILIASSVMAEGVDLHLNCMNIIHHDLCWNPSTLEQRTGRVDRIGSKSERYGHPINVYIPYLSETQDEKMYRVVMDRERWFKVVMGEKYKIKHKDLEKISERLPFPENLARKLAFDLSVYK